jgi:DNA-binding transcriptional regulator YiaG
MTPYQFREHQKALNMTNKEMADALQVTISAVDRWRAGARNIPGPVRVAINLLLDRRPK